ncbi:MAG: DNA-3-methyladenine glycosylase I [Acidimicrobiia bacterium]
MTFDLSPKPPRTADAFLELLARTIFSSGLTWQAVEPRWANIRGAFDGFSVRKIAAYGSDDTERIMRTPGMIRNPSKILAVVESAIALAAIRNEHGSVKRWLDGLSGYEERTTALRRFPYVGRWGAYYVLSVAGYEVPPYEEWKASA